MTYITEKLDEFDEKFEYKNVGYQPDGFAILLDREDGLPVSSEIIKSHFQSSLLDILKEAERKVEGKRAEMICFCGELKDKYSCDGYCHCGAFIKNRRGYSEKEKGELVGYNKGLDEALSVIREMYGK